MKRRIAAALLITLLPLGMAACGGNKSDNSTASPDGNASATPSQGAESDQSVTDACATIEPSVRATSEELSAAAQEARSNPQKGLDTLKSLTSRLEDTASTISNANVKDSLDAVIADMGAAAASAEDLLSNHDPSAFSDLQAALQQLSASLADLQDLCAFE